MTQTAGLKSSSRQPLSTKTTQTSPHRPGHAPRPAVGNVCAAVAGLGFGAILGLVVTGETTGSLAAPGGLLIAGGRLAGFSGAYFLLVMVLLMSRIPWLERSVGQDRLVRWHRRLAPWAIGLITAHVVLITLGYAQLAKTGALRQMWIFLTSYPDLLAAVVGFGLLIMAAMTSIKIARKHLKYETWWIVHLYTYLALALAFAHQIVTGGAFVGHPLTRAIWIAVWALTAGMVLVARVFLPIARSLRHQIRIESVKEETPGVFSIICSGRQLDRLAVSGGQYFQWRFLTKELWWQAHPYSLSALPRPPFMRVTIKALGDHGAAVAHLKRGTRVGIEGPYGAFTHHVRSSQRVALIGAGVGVTPLRALLEELPHSVDVVVVVRASTAEDFVHRDEIVALIAERGGLLHEVVGPRGQVRFDAQALHRLVPDIAHRDVYLCGPEGFSGGMLVALRRLGVRSHRIHHETFVL